MKNLLPSSNNYKEVSEKGNGYFWLQNQQLLRTFKIHESEAINEACVKSTLFVVNMPHLIDLKMRPFLEGPPVKVRKETNFMDDLLKSIL